MKLVIRGVPPWDGEYDFDSFTAQTSREFHRIKEISGVRAGEFLEALGAGDTGAWVGFAVVVLARHGKVVDPDELWDADSSAIDFEAGTRGDVADPPTIASSESEPEEKPSFSGSDSESGSG